MDNNLIIYYHVLCFRKFEHFRKLIILDISVLLKLTINTDAGRTLPPPKKFAADLEIYSIKCIKEWSDEFGKDFKDEFNFVFKYLNKYKKVGYYISLYFLYNMYNVYCNTFC